MILDTRGHCASTAQFLYTCSRRRQKAQSMAVKRQHPDIKEQEAQIRAAKRQCADVREKESQAMATIEKAPVS